jgi:hypothetical protein
VIERCQHPDTTTTGHGNPDRQPVRCLAFDLAHLPVIATRHRSTLAPSSLRGRLHRSRGRKTDRTAGDRALPARATPAATADCPHPESLTRPRHDRSAAVALSRVRPGTTCRRSPPGTARHWRRRRFVAGFTDRENEGPTELPMVERCQHPGTTTTGHGNPDRQPVRCPAFATRHRSTLAPLSPRGRLHQSRGRKPDRTADGRALPAPRHHDHRPRQPRSAAGTLSRVRPCPLAGDRHQAPFNPSAVVASWPASPIERTKDRPNCRWSSAASTPTPQPQATATPIGSRYAVPPSPPGTARRWRRCRLVGGFTNREDEGPTELPAIEHCQQPDILPTPRQPRSAAGTLSRLRPGPLAGDRHPAPLDTGAVVASWPASPIDRTKARPNCR